MKQSIFKIDTLTCKNKLNSSGFSCIYRLGFPSLSRLDYSTSLKFFVHAYSTILFEGLRRLELTLGVLVTMFRLPPAQQRGRWGCLQAGDGCSARRAAPRHLFICLGITQLEMYNFMLPL